MNELFLGEQKKGGPLIYTPSFNAHFPLKEKMGRVLSQLPQRQL